MSRARSYRRLIGGSALGATLLGGLFFQGRAIRWVVEESGIAAQSASRTPRLYTSTINPSPQADEKPMSLAEAKPSPQCPVTTGNAPSTGGAEPTGLGAFPAPTGRAEAIGLGRDTAPTQGPETTGTGETATPIASAHSVGVDAATPQRPATAVNAISTRSSDPSARATYDWAAYRPVVISNEPSIRKYVRYFSRDPSGRRTFQLWLDRARHYVGMIHEQLDREGLPHELLAVAMIESGLDPLAVSPAGATGMWQFIEDTGRLYGLAQTNEVDQRRSPLLATRAAARYLRDLYDRFQDWPLALAGYNAGEARIEQLLEDTLSHDFWSLTVHSADLPEETAQYVPKVLATMTILRAARAYGFEPVLPQPVSGKVTLTAAAATPLDLLARALALPLEALRRMNPEVTANCVPSLRGANSVHVPVNRAELGTLVLGEDDQPADSDTLRKLASVTPPHFTLHDAPCFPSKCQGDRDSSGWHRMHTALDTISHRIYRVKAGDSLEKLAAFFHVEPRRLMQDNGLRDPRALQAGQALRVPLHETM